MNSPTEINGNTCVYGGNQWAIFPSDVSLLKYTRDRFGPIYLKVQHRALNGNIGAEINRGASNTEKKLTFLACA